MAMATGVGILVSKKRITGKER
ncbi:MAG: hypothetical protein AB4368_29835 [Xenococcaceae cyanobacterium]